MIKTTPQQKATAERKREKKKKLLQGQKGSSEKMVDSKKNGRFFAKATKHEIPQTSTGSLRLQIAGGQGRDGRRGENGYRPSSAPFPFNPAPTLERAQRRQRTKTATVAQYILHIVNTQREVAMNDTKHIGNTFLRRNHTVIRVTGWKRRSWVA